MRPALLTPWAANDPSDLTDDLPILNEILDLLNQLSAVADWHVGEGVVVRVVKDPALRLRRNKTIDLAGLAHRSVNAPLGTAERELEGMSAVERKPELRHVRRPLPVYDWDGDRFALTSRHGFGNSSSLQRRPNSVGAMTSIAF